MQTYENEKYFLQSVGATSRKEKKRGDRKQCANRKADNQRMISLTADNDKPHVYETGGSHQLSLDKQTVKTKPKCAWLIKW